MLRVVSGNGQPRRDIGWAEAGVGRVVPQHGGALRVASDFVGDFGLIDGLRVAHELGRDGHVGHADFVAVIPGGRTAQRKQEHGGDARLILAQARGDAPLVVIAQHPVGPTPRGLHRFVFIHHRAHALRIPGRANEMKVEGEVALVAHATRQWVTAVVIHESRIGQVDFAHQDALLTCRRVLVEQAAHGTDDAMHFRLISGVDMIEAEDGRAAAPVRVGWLVTQGGVLDHEPDDVHTEAVDAALEPDAHFAQHGLKHGRVSVVEFGLVAVELVQIVLARCGIQRPGGAAKVGEPVVGWAAIGSGVAPDVPVALWIRAAGAALHKPGVLVGGVVGHKVEQHLHVAGVCAVQQLREVIDRAEDGFNAGVVGHVVAEIVHGRGVDGREPEGVDVNALEVIEALDNALQIADAIAGAILKRARVDLVNDGLLPPAQCARCVHAQAPWVAGLRHRADCRHSDDGCKLVAR